MSTGVIKVISSYHTTKLIVADICRPLIFLVEESYFGSDCTRE